MKMNFNQEQVTVTLVAFLVFLVIFTIANFILHLYYNREKTTDKLRTALENQYYNNGQVYDHWIKGGWSEVVAAFAVALPYFIAGSCVAMGLYHYTTSKAQATMYQNQAALLSSVPTDRVYSQISDQINQY